MPARWCMSSMSCAVRSRPREARWAPPEGDQPGSATTKPARRALSEISLTSQPHRARTAADSSGPKNVEAGSPRAPTPAWNCSRRASLSAEPPETEKETASLQPTVERPRNSVSTDSRTGRSRYTATPSNRISEGAAGSYPPAMIACPKPGSRKSAATKVTWAAPIPRRSSRARLSACVAGWSTSNHLTPSLA